MTTLHSYKMSRDFGFAPNPFWGICTLACCKPRVRRSAQVNDWVVAAGVPKNNMQNCVVFGMRVTETMTFDEYWNDPRFQCKKPVLNNSAKYFFGDNIYHDVIEKRSAVQSNSHHSLPDGGTNCDNLTQDIKSNKVLISEDFIYFGRSAPCIPEPLRFQNGANFPTRSRDFQKAYSTGHVNAIVAWLRSFNEWGVVGLPEAWKNPYE